MKPACKRSQPTVTYVFCVVNLMAGGETLKFPTLFKKNCATREPYSTLLWRDSAVSPSWWPRCLPGHLQSLCRWSNRLVHLEAKMYCQGVYVHSVCTTFHPPPKACQWFSLGGDRANSATFVSVLWARHFWPACSNTPTTADMGGLPSRVTVPHCILTRCLAGSWGKQVGLMLCCVGRPSWSLPFLCFMCKYSNLLMFSGTKVDVDYVVVEKTPKHFWGYFCTNWTMDDMSACGNALVHIWFRT